MNTMNFKSTNTTLDTSLFKTKEDVLKFVSETNIEIDDINNQIKDYVELLDIANKLNTEIDIDPDWIIKAQCARRIKLNHIKTIQEWLKTYDDGFSKKEDSIKNKLDLLELQITSLKKKIEKEKISRTNTLEEHRKQIGFTFRAIRELYLLIKSVLFNKNFDESKIVCQEQLSWVDEVILNNPKSLLLKNE